MSAAKKRRELNRATEEHDKHRLSAEFAISKHNMMNIAESVLGQQIKTQADRIDELEAENEKLSLYKNLADEYGLSALDAMIAKAGEVMRERCHSCDNTIINGEYWINAEAIRAPPGVTIGDLK